MSDVERGLGAIFMDMIPFNEPDADFPVPINAAKQSFISSSGRVDSEGRDTFYPQGTPTFFQKLANEYDYPVDIMPESGMIGIDPLYGSTRLERPRPDLPNPQELRDTRAHMLASALLAKQYGPETALKAGNLREMFTNKLDAAMDKRNNAVGINLFKAAGINATPMELAQSVDDAIFEQLDLILGRAPGERKRRSDSDETVPDVYFPRDDEGRLISEY
tara:strand:+ start:2158 stop:2814 length:657 start_codon:yes stop_codon:yes gene_type:complete